MSVRKAVADPAPIDVAAMTGVTSPAVAQPRSLLELPPGEARKGLLAVHRILGKELPPHRLKIYEAGGGSTSYLPLDVLHRACVTVVDIDSDQIRNNDYAQEKILGDVQSHRFTPGRFDLVICYNVIEHLRDAEAALLGFFEAVKRGGLILIGAPNPNSLSGIVTRYSPHWFHVWFYRHVRGEKTAGQPGQPPFATFFDPLVALSALETFATRHGLEVIYSNQYESPRYQEMRAQKPLLAAVLDAAATVLNWLLRGDAEVRRGDYHLILRKR